MLGVADELRDELSRTLARVVGSAVERGAWDEALEHARRRVQVEPLSEPAHADLIRVTAWSGDRPGALQAYRGLVRLLDRELGVPPLPQTLALHEDIRAGRLRAPSTTIEHPAGESVSTAERRVGAAEVGELVPVTDGPRLIGRDAQVRRLGDAWRGLSAATPGRLFGIVGEPGLGKTVLAGTVAALAGRRVLRVAGRAAETALAYAAANDLVRAMLGIQPDLAAKLGSTATPLAALATQVDASAPRAIRTPGDLQRVHEAVRIALAQLAADDPVLLVVDGAELIDRPSAVLLGYLARRLPAGLLMVVAWTPGTTGGALQQAVVQEGETLALHPFDAAQIAELVGDDVDPYDVLRRTRGIPLLVRELAAAPSEAEEREVRDIVAARFAGASETARQVVAAAVVIGTVAPPELLRAVSGRDETETVEAIEEAVARGLLVEHAETPGYDVPHDLVRTAALHAAVARPPPPAARARRRCARAAARGRSARDSGGLGRAAPRRRRPRGRGGGVVPRRRGGVGPGLGPRGGDRAAARRARARASRRRRARGDRRRPRAPRTLRGGARGARSGLGLSRVGCRPSGRDRARDRRACTTGSATGSSRSRTSNRRSSRRAATRVAGAHGCWPTWRSCSTGAVAASMLARPRTPRWRLRPHPSTAPRARRRRMCSAWSRSPRARSRPRATTWWMPWRGRVRTTMTIC